MEKRRQLLHAAEIKEKLISKCLQQCQPRSPPPTGRTATAAGTVPNALLGVREHAHRSHRVAIAQQAPARAMWTARHAATPEPSCSWGSCQAAGNPAGSRAASNQHPGAHIHCCSNICKPRVLPAHKAGSLLAPLQAPTSCPRPSPGPGKKGPFSLQSSCVHSWMQLSSFAVLETDIAPRAVTQPPPTLARPHTSGGQHVWSVTIHWGVSETHSNATEGISAGPTNSCPVQHPLV